MIEELGDVVLEGERFSPSCPRSELKHGDCLHVMRDIPADSIDMTLTSPPYGTLRSYEGYDFNATSVACEIFRVSKPGATCVWITGDQTRNGSESGESFRQALTFMDIGFRLHDTMIYAKSNPVPLTHNRYEQAFEYMFVFSKGKPKVFVPLREPCKYFGGKSRMTHRAKSDALLRANGHGKPISGSKIRNNIWTYSIGKGHSSSNPIAHEHPAIFPESLAADLISTWTKDGDTVLDPFCGSGTTLIAASRLNRNSIGIDTSSRYLQIARHRLQLENDTKD